MLGFAQLAEVAIIADVSSLALLLAVLGQKSIDTTQAVEGVWVDEKGSHVFIGNGRVDWDTVGTVDTAMLEPVTDGTLYGKYYAAEEIEHSLDENLATRSTQTPAWSLDFHLYPKDAGKRNPNGEARITVLQRKPTGETVRIALDVTPNGRNPIKRTLVRSAPFSSFSLAGNFADKDATFVLDDPAGRTGTVHGSLTYLGKRMSFSGRRIMGRVGFLLFDDSRPGVVGSGYALWTPSPSRAIEIRDRTTTDTDQISIFFVLKDRSVASGAHKTIRRSP